MNYLKNIFKLYGKFIVVVLLIFVFFFIAEEFLKKSILDIDYSMYDNLIKPIINDTNTVIFKIITNMSSTVVLIILTLLSYFIFKDKRYPFYIIINLGLVIALNLILKEAFSRARPEDLMLIDESGYSFPSGHSMASMAFYGFYIYLICKSNWPKIFKVSSTIIAGILIALIGISRIYLGVHYLSDVIAGFAIALAYLILYTTVIDRLITKKEKTHPRGPLWKSFYYAIQGIAKSTVVERNMAIHFTIVLMVVIFGFTFSINTSEWIICIILFGLVISLELTNTAIENAIDICMPRFHPKAKIAKDTAAGAVLVAAIVSAIIGLIIFVPKILALFNF